eukprot:TRINITY_DN7481_c0_g1_i9.p2 TRINITY_DN7481_c0_g1~~TRINITY_DN7481_c0_g1_i9.p2  ORF type:complete len:256 (+),score=54.57 TRINITY_DN7481_c0_g1_i9:49-768(+)
MCIRDRAFFFFKQKTAYEIMPSLVGSEMCIRDRSWSPNAGDSLQVAFGVFKYVFVLTINVNPDARDGIQQLQFYEAHDKTHRVGFIVELDGGRYLHSIHPQGSRVVRGAVDAIKKDGKIDNKIERPFRSPDSPVRWLCGIGTKYFAVSDGVRVSLFHDGFAGWSFLPKKESDITLPIKCDAAFFHGDERLLITLLSGGKVCAYGINWSEKIALPLMEVRSLQKTPHRVYVCNPFFGSKV